MGRPRGGGSGTSYGLRRRSGGSAAVVSPMLYSTGVELMMECFDDVLSPSQIEAARKAKEEFKKAQKKIEEAKAEVARAAAAAAAKAEAERLAAVRAEAERQAELAAAAAAAEAAAAIASRARQNNSGSTSPDIMIVGESPPLMGQKMVTPRPGQTAIPKPVSGPIINSIATHGVLPPHVAGVPQEMYRFANHGQNNAAGQQLNQWFLRPIRPGVQQGLMAARSSTSPGGPRQPGTPGAPNVVTIVSGTSGLGIKRAINSPEEAAMGPLIKRARGRFVNDGSNGSGGNWVPLDEYYYGKMEGDPAFTDDKGEFRFRCWICTKMLYNNIKAMMHLQGHIDSEKQQNLDLSDLTQCKHCYKQFDTPFEMQTHIEKVHLSNMNVLMCRICEKDHESRGALTNHMRQNHCACEMPYACHLCHFRSSMYSDVVDHFKKKHDSSDSMLCLYCLRVFHVKFVSQGWGQTQVYYHHLLRHQSKTSNRKCTFCKLSFFNSQDMKNHRKIHHQPNQKGVIGVNQKQNTADQVMIKVPETGIMSSKAGGPKSLNAPTVSKVLEHRGLHLPAGTAVSYCFECKMLMNTGDHYKKYIQCSMCRFATSCSFAYATHMMGFHSGQLSALSHSVPVERALPSPLYCLCGFSSKFGNKTANHLVFCSKRTGYLNKPEAPPPERPGPDEIDPRRKPDASILDVLGLVKKQSVVNTCVEEEDAVSAIKNIPDDKDKAHLTSFTEEYKMQHPPQEEETKGKASPPTSSPDITGKEDTGASTTPHQQAPDTNIAASPPSLEDSSSAKNILSSVEEEEGRVEELSVLPYVEEEERKAEVEEEGVKTEKMSVLPSSEEEERKAKEQSVLPYVEEEERKAKEQSVLPYVEEEKRKVEEQSVLPYVEEEERKVEEQSVLPPVEEEEEGKIEEQSESVGQEWEMDKEAALATETEDRMETEETEPSCEDGITSIIPPEEGSSQDLPGDVAEEEDMEMEEDSLSNTQLSAVEDDGTSCPEGDLQDVGDTAMELQHEQSGKSAEEKELMETDEILLAEDQDKSAQDDSSQQADEHVGDDELPQDLAQEPESAKDQDLTVEEEEELLGTGKDEAGLPLAEDVEPSSETRAEIYPPEESGDAPLEENDALATGGDEVLTLDEYLEGTAEEDKETASEDKERVPEDDQELVPEENGSSTQEDDGEAVSEEPEGTSREQEQEPTFERTEIQMGDEEGEAEGKAAEDSLPPEEGGENTHTPDTDSNQVNPDEDQEVTKKDDQDDVSEETKPEDKADTHRDSEPEDSPKEKTPEPAPDDKGSDQTSGDASSAPTRQVPEESADTESSRGTGDASNRETDSTKLTAVDPSRGDGGSGTPPVPGQPEESEAVRKEEPNPRDKRGESDSEKPAAPPAAPGVTGTGKGWGPPSSSQYPARPIPGSSSDRDRQHSRDHDHKDRSHDRSRDYSHHQDSRRDRDYRDRNRDNYNRHNQYDRHRDQRYDNQQGRYQQGSYQQGSYQQGRYQQGGYSSQDRYYNQNRPGNRGGQNRQGYNDRNYHRGYY